MRQTTLSVLLLSILHSVPGLAFSLDASLFNNCPAQKVDYYKQDMIFIPKAVPVFAATGSIPRLIAVTRDGKSSRCGGTVISDNCEILTAVHCLLKLDEPGHEKLNPVYVNGTPSQVELVASGLARKDWPKLTPSTMSQDWAIIRVAPSLCGTCLKASNQYTKGMDVWAAGYPKKTEAYKNNSTGDGSMFFSPGRAYGSYKESPKAKDWDSVANDKDPAVRDRFRKMVLASSTATGGNSGGPLLNAKGEIVAVSQSSTTEVAGKDKDGKDILVNSDSDGAMLYTPISEIQRQLGPEKSAKIFNCKGHNPVDGTDQFIPTQNL